jgi:hypothetical protein
VHIDHDNLTLNNESDVEQKVVMPLLAEDIYLAIPGGKIFRNSTSRQLYWIRLLGVLPDTTQTIQSG